MKILKMLFETTTKEKVSPNIKTIRLSPKQKIYANKLRLEKERKLKK